jgi:hypothetical protein
MDEPEIVADWRDEQEVEGNKRGKCGLDSQPEYQVDRGVQYHQGWKREVQETHQKCLENAVGGKKNENKEDQKTEHRSPAY